MDAGEEKKQKTRKQTIMMAAGRLENRQLTMAASRSRKWAERTETRN
jgi:hypothetical protein